MADSCDCGKVYINDKGTEIILDCGEDISSGIEFKILWQDPDGNTGEWIGAVYNSNYVRYVNPNEWAIDGQWKFQAYVGYATGYHFYGVTYEEEIYPLFG